MELRIKERSKQMRSQIGGKKWRQIRQRGEFGAQVVRLSHFKIKKELRGGGIKPKLRTNYIVRIQKVVMIMVDTSGLWFIFVVWGHTMYYVRDINFSILEVENKHQL
jgi:hypothetical protein